MLLGLENVQDWCIVEYVGVVNKDCEKRLIRIVLHMLTSIQLVCPKRNKANFSTMKPSSHINYQETLALGFVPAPDCSPRA